MDSDVIVVGAGCCGLATALALGQQGVSVILLEQRQNIASSPKEVKRVASILRAEASDQYSDAHRVMQKYWGTQQRNVVMDSHCTAHLRSLGIESTVLSQVRSSHLTSAGGPSVKLEFPKRSVSAWPLSDNLDQMLLRRDWSCIAPLGKLEQALFDQISNLTCVKVLFESAANALDITPAGVTVKTKRRDYRARFLVLTDGGGRSSLTNKLGVKRKVYQRSRMSFAVVEQKHQKKESDSALIEMGFDATSRWFGIIGNGTTISGAIPLLPEGNTHSSTALEFLRSRGWTGNLVEPPAEITITTAQADKICLSPRVVLAGDAAAQGDPRTGLGFQMAMYWAQYVIDQLDVKRFCVDPKRYQQKGFNLAARKRKGELSLLRLYDADSPTPVELSMVSLTNSGLHALDGVNLDLARDKRGRLNGSFALSLIARPEKIVGHPSIHALLKFLKQVNISGTVRLCASKNKYGGLRLTSKITASRMITIRTGPQTLCFHTGTLCLQQRNKSWRLEIHEGIAHQKLHKKKVGEFKIDQLRIKVPKAHINNISADLLKTLKDSAIPAIKIHTTVDPGQRLRMGHLVLQSVGKVKLTVEISMHPVTTISISVERGHLRPLHLSRLLASHQTNATRWISKLSELTGQRLDPTIDEVGAMAALQIREINVRYEHDNSALVTVKLPGKLEFSLTQSEAEEIVTEVLEFSRLSNTAWDAIQSLDSFSIKRSDRKYKPPRN